jgi:hypothetical protein
VWVTDDPAPSGYGANPFADAQAAVPTSAAPPDYPYDDPYERINARIHEEEHTSQGTHETGPL